MAQFTYSYPVSGTTPPTAAQMNVPGAIATMITGTLQMLDADTTITITHNMAFGATGVSQLKPWINVLPSLLETVNPFITVGLPTVAPGNTFTVNKNSGAGTGFSAVVFILRPHTIIQ